MRAVKVLVVDDCAEFRKLLERLLRELGFEICGSVGSGLAALDDLDAAAPDVVILDLAMPGLNGLEAAKLIRERRRGVKTVILTMHSAPEYREAAAQAGVDAYVCKTDLMPELHLALGGLRK